MALQNRRILVLLHGTIFLVVTNSAIQVSHQTEGTKPFVGSPAFDLHQNDVKIKTTNANNQEINADMHEELGKHNPVLQTRGLSFANIFGKGNYEIEGSEPGSPKKSRVSYNLDGSILGNSISSYDGITEFSCPRGYYLTVAQNGVLARVISPKPQNYGTRWRRKVVVNGDIVCDNYRTLGDKQKYQKRSDGSMWYTNLKVGVEMTPQEIEEFKKVEEEMEDAMDKAKREKEAFLKNVNRHQVVESRRRREAQEGAKRREGARRQKRAAQEEGRRSRGSNSRQGSGWFSRSPSRTR